MTELPAPWSTILWASHPSQITIHTFTLFSMVHVWAPLLPICAKLLPSPLPWLWLCCTVVFPWSPAVLALEGYLVPAFAPTIPLDFTTSPRDRGAPTLLTRKLRLKEAWASHQSKVTWTSGQKSSPTFSMQKFTVLWTSLFFWGGFPLILYYSIIYMYTLHTCTRFTNEVWNYRLILKRLLGFTVYQ